MYSWIRFKKKKNQKNLNLQIKKPSSLFGTTDYASSDLNCINLFPVLTCLQALLPLPQQR